MDGSLSLGSGAAETGVDFAMDFVFAELAFVGGVAGGGFPEAGAGEEVAPGEDVAHDDMVGGHWGEGDGVPKVFDAVVFKGVADDEMVGDLFADAGGEFFGGSGDAEFAERTVVRVDVEAVDGAIAEPGASEAVGDVVDDDDFLFDVHFDVLPDVEGDGGVAGDLGGDFGVDFIPGVAEV